MTEVAQMSCSAFSHITPQQQYQQMDDDIASLKADMFAHPENTVIDQQDIALVQQDEALTREAMDNTNKINADLRAAGVNPDMNSASYQEVLSLGSRMNEINETLGINKELLKLHTDIAQAQTDMVQNPQNTTEDQSKISADIIEADRKSTRLNSSHRH